MANLPDGSGDAYSNIVQGKGTASLAFTMPATVPLAITSIVATVDNAAGADTYATLTYADSSGQVIAKKRQGVVIPAGGSGTATWALRLDDETTATAGAGIQFNTDNEGGSLYAQTNDCVDIDFLPDPLAVGGTWGTVLEDDSSCGLLIGSTSQVLVKGRNAPVTVLADGANVELSSNGGNIDNNLMQTGTAYVVRDHLGAAIFQVDEDGTITGAPIIGGIGFDVANMGDWLDIETTGSDADGWGVQIHDTANDAKGIKLFSDEGEIEVTATDNSLAINANNEITITCATEAVTITADGTNGVQLTGGVATGTINNSAIFFTLNTGTDFQVLDAASGTLFNVNEDSTVTVNLGAGKAVTVNDSSGNPIFRVNEDGSLQGKTGKALTFNL